MAIEFDVKVSANHGSSSKPMVWDSWLRQHLAASPSLVSPLLINHLAVSLLVNRIEAKVRGYDPRGWGSAC